MIMPAPAADRALDLAAPASTRPTSGGGGPKINPATGLSTDYLNHFTEAVMVLEMVGGMPECLDDLRAWEPKSYAEHFAVSAFSNRAAIVAAYEACDPRTRTALDQASAALNAMIGRARELALRHAGTPEVETVARRALSQIRPLLARTAATINGTGDEPAGRQGPQAAIDAMFQR
jgi:hypothetical protein